jgi:hypothetical protein
LEKEDAQSPRGTVTVRKMTRELPVSSVPQACPTDNSDHAQQKEVVIEEVCRGRGGGAVGGWLVVLWAFGRDVSRFLRAASFLIFL